MRCLPNSHDYRDFFSYGDQERGPDANIYWNENRLCHRDGQCDSYAHLFYHLLRNIYANPHLNPNI